MKNPFKQLWQYFQSLLRKRAIKKREEVYDTVIDKLGAIHDAKVKVQEELKKEIITYMIDFLGYDVVSDYIPKKYKNKAEIKLEINKKYLFRMQKAGVTLNDELKFICD